MATESLSPYAPGHHAAHEYMVGTAISTTPQLLLNAACAEVRNE